MTTPFQTIPFAALLERSQNVTYETVKHLFDAKWPAQIMAELPINEVQIKAMTEGAENIGVRVELHRKDCDLLTVMDIAYEVSQIEKATSLSMTVEDFNDKNWTMHRETGIHKFHTEVGGGKVRSVKYVFLAKMRKPK